MKKIIYSILVFSLFYSLSLLSQVGIKTDYPRSLFHIDAASDNTSGALSDGQIANDVVLSSEGKLGVGVLNPQARLDIANDMSITGFQTGLRLTPGLGSPSILALQPDGITSKWEINPALGKVGYFTATVGQSFFYAKPSRVKLSLVSGDVSLTNNVELRVPTEGRYLFTVTVTGFINVKHAALSERAVMSLYVYLSKNDILGDNLSNADYYRLMGNDLLDVIEFYQAVNPPDFRETTPAYISFTTSLYAGYCKPTDYLSLRFAPTIGFEFIGTLLINPECKVQITVYNI